MKRKTALLCALLACAYLWVFLVLQYAQPRTITLHIGLFAGSNWNVPQGDSYAFLDTVAARFEATHPGVKIRYVSGILQEDYSEWLAEQELSGTMPDLFFLPSEDFALYAGLDALRDLTPFIEADPACDLAGFYPAPLADGIEDGRYYALPVECVPRLMFVNKTLLSREGIPLPHDGWTWEDFLAICRRVTRDTDGDGRVDQFGVYGYTWEDAVVTSGATLFWDQGRASRFADARVEDALRFLIDLHQLPEIREARERDFDLGRVAFRPFNFAAYRAYRPYPWRIKKATDFEWECVRLPKGPAGANTSPIQTLLMAMSAQTSHKDLAWEFLKAISLEKENQHLVLEKTAALPVRRDVLEAATPEEIFGAGTGESDRSPHAISAVLDDGKSPDRFQGYAAVMRLADQRIQEIVDGVRPFDNALNQLQKEVNALLQETP